MTSANVSDVPILLNFGQTQVQSAAKSENSFGNFQDLMTKNVSVMNLTASSAGEVSLPQQNTISDLQTATYDAAKKVPQSDANARPDANKFASMTDEKQALRDFADKTNAVLEETLDVTEEEIVAAMENLGLCYMDLLDPNNLTKLVSELSMEESVSLLVTNTVTDILDQVQTLGIELLSSVDADVATLKNVELFADGFAPVIDEEVPVTIGDINQTTENEEILPQMTSNEVLPQEIAKPTDASHEDALQVAEVVILPEEEEAHITKPNTDSTNQTVDMTNDVAEEAEGGLQEILQKSGSDASENGNTNSQYNRKNETPVSNDHLVRSSEQNLATSFTTTTQVVGESVEQVTTYSYGIDTRDVIEQIVSNAKVTISNQVTSMEMELNPQNLGRMILNVAENDGKVTAHITLQNEAVRHAMESQMAVLKENLNQQGIKVEAVEVSVGTHEFERNLEEGQMQQSNQQTEEHAASQTRRTNINLNQMDDLDEMLSEAEALVASMMKDAGNSVNFTA